MSLNMDPANDLPILSLALCEAARAYVYAAMVDDEAAENPALAELEAAVNRWCGVKVFADSKGIVLAGAPR